MFAHPSLTLLSDSFSREDLFLVVFCLVDDWMQQPYQSANLPRRRGPAPTTCTDLSAEAFADGLAGGIANGSARAYVQYGHELDP